MSGCTSAFDAKRALCQMGDGGPYNTTARQRERILERLQHGPATRADLERECWAPSVTKRIAELRRKGWRILSPWAAYTAPDGSVSGAVLYTLAPGPADTAQLALPLEP